MLRALANFRFWALAAALGWVTGVFLLISQS